MGGKREERGPNVRRRERRSGPISKRTANGGPAAPRRRSERIAANERLTIPAGFFSAGVASQVARKSATTSALEATRGASPRRPVERTRILDEDLHGLLQQTRPPPALQQTVASGCYQNASNYYLRLLADDNRPRANKDERPQKRCANGDFCAVLRAQIKVPRVRRTALVLIDRIRVEACKLLGSRRKRTAMNSAQKRPVPADDDDGGPADECPPIRLVPQSEWVYSTPVKQSIKKFVFEDDAAKFLPAVFHTSKKTKVLYDIKNEFVQHVNLSRYKAGENVPIDKRFLKTICESSVDQEPAVPQAKKKKTHDCEKENRGFEFVAPQPVAAAAAAAVEYNMFLAKNAEESVDIGEVIERGDLVAEQTSSPVLFHFAESRSSEGRKFNFEQCRSALPCETFYAKDKSNTLQEKAIPLNYQHQLLLATERPCKTTKKVERRHLLKAKCLSFESATPPSGGAKPDFEPKKLTPWECFEYDYLDQFEKECEASNAEGRVPFPATNAPHTVTSGALNEPSQTNSMFDAFSSALPTASSSASSFLPPWKFYPRCNFDPE